MRKITFTADDKVAQHASEAARKIGKNLDQVVLDYLEQLAGSAQSRFSDKTYCALLDEAAKGLADVAAGSSSDARASILAIQTRRSASRIRNAPRTESKTPL
jgi:hypothetical protein